MTNDCQGQGGRDGAESAPNADPDAAMRRQALQDAASSVREALAAAGAFTSVAETMRDVAGFSSVIGPGSGFDQMMRDTQRSMTESMKSITNGLMPMANHTTWMNTVMGGAHRSVTETMRDVAGFSSVIGPGSGFDQMMRDTQRSMTESMKSITNGLMPMANHTTWMNTVMGSTTESIAAHMRSWSMLAESGHWIARLALRMALAARDSVKRGDRDAVKRFMIRWLGFKFVSWDLVNSASLVLLDTRRWLPDDDLALDFDPTPQLRRLTLEEHRRCTRLLTDTNLQANGKSILSLNTTVSPEDPDYTLLDNLAAKGQDDDSFEYEIVEPRALRVLARLSERERNIVAERGHVGTTWADAAVACGGTPEEGETLRRKVKRLSMSVSARSAQCPPPDPWVVRAGGVG